MEHDDLLDDEAIVSRNHDLILKTFGEDRTLIISEEGLAALAKVRIDPFGYLRWMQWEGLPPVKVIVVTDNLGQFQYGVNEGGGKINELGPDPWSNYQVPMVDHEVAESRTVNYDLVDGEWVITKRGI